MCCKFTLHCQLETIDGQLKYILSYFMFEFWKTKIGLACSWRRRRPAQLIQTAHVHANAEIWTSAHIRITPIYQCGQVAHAIITACTTNDRHKSAHSSPRWCIWGLGISSCILWFTFWLQALRMALIEVHHWTILHNIYFSLLKTFSR